MITNNPFKTREEALKTLLKMDPDTVLIVLMFKLNPDAGPADMFDCFHNLYVKHPNDFSISHSEDNAQHVELQYMNREVCCMATGKAAGITSTKLFFDLWFDTLKNMGILFDN